LVSETSEKTKREGIKELNFILDNAKSDI